MIKKAGFVNAELVEKTGFNSSPVTEGVLIRAGKQTTLNKQTK